MIEQRLTRAASAGVSSIAGDATEFWLEAGMIASGNTKPRDLNCGCRSLISFPYPKNASGQMGRRYPRPSLLTSMTRFRFKNARPQTYYQSAPDRDQCGTA